jgi:AbrB family looped-hinge helix DNA binding protein
VGKSSVVRVDQKGRILIPSNIREELGMRENTYSLVALDSQKSRIMITPLVKKVSKLARIEIGFSDSPGALAKAAKILAEGKVDLIHSESRSTSRGEKAEWEIIADVSKADMKKMKKELIGKKVADRVGVSLL